MHASVCLEQTRTCEKKHAKTQIPPPTTTTTTTTPTPTPTTAPTPHTHNNNKVQTGCVAIFCVTFCWPNPRGRPMAARDGADGGTGSARRRRERRLRSWLRHEQQSIAAVLPMVTHHSFDKVGTASGVLRNLKTATRTGKGRSTRRTTRPSSGRLLSRQLQPPCTTRLRTTREVS